MPRSSGLAFSDPAACALRSASPRRSGCTSFMDSPRPHFAPTPLTSGVAAWRSWCAMKRSISSEEKVRSSRSTSSSTKATWPCSSPYRPARRDSWKRRMNPPRCSSVREITTQCSGLSSMMLLSFLYVSSTQSQDSAGKWWITLYRTTAALSGLPTAPSTTMLRFSSCGALLLALRGPLRVTAGAAALCFCWCCRRPSPCL
mmetsp:Transcript_25899/g.81092  ORF Transcript_25899/g.81092 Transcript_25899/m.81092 type:complete len:201 (-) Transcript_25899:399-1001(-)